MCPTAKEQSRKDSPGCREGSGLIRGGASPGHKRSHSISSRQRGGLCQSNVPCPKVRRLMATSDKLEITQQVRGYSPFQDGINQDGKRANPKGGLASQARPEGRVSCSPHTPFTPKVPEVPVARPDLAIQGSSIWSEQCTVHLLQTPEAGCFHTAEARNQVNSLPGRYADNGRKQGGSEETLGHGNGTAGGSWFYNQPEEEHPLSNTGVGISGLPAGFPQHDNCPTNTKVACLEEDGEKDDKPEEDDNTGTGFPHRINGSRSPGNPSSTSPLQALGESQVKGTQEKSHIRDSDGDRHRHGVRHGMVGGQLQPPQWETPADCTMGSNDRIRCIHDRLGGQLPGGEYWRTLDSPGKDPPHQLPGATGCLPSCEVICLQTKRDLYPPPSGQYHSDCIPEQDGRYPFTPTLKPSSRDLELVPQEKHDYPRGAPSGGRECASRLGVSTQDRFQRLEAQSGDIPTVGGQVGLFLNRHVCFPNECPTSTVLQLETGPSGLDGGCFLNLMEGTLPIHVPSICPHPTLPAQAQRGEGDSSPDSPSLAQPDLVPSASQRSDRPSNPPSPHSGYCDQFRGPKPPNGNGGPPSTGRLACLRRSYHAEGLSDRVINVIRKSWRVSTESAYSSIWRRWDSWCFGRGIDPLSAPISDILEFLCDQFEAGKKYRTINSMRSAISMTHDDVDGTRVGQHPLVSRFLKGVFNSRPPAPRYSVTWDVDVVLSYIQNLPDNEVLSFKLLSCKVAMLMALANADRCSDLVALDLTYRYFSVSGVRFVIPGLTKTRRNGPPVEAFYSAFPENPKLCPVQALRCYEERSAGLRSKPSNALGNPLFVSVRKPHKPVKAATIGRWLRNVMSSAGIDTKIFLAHSTRGAATSKAKLVGVSSADILKAACWSSTSTFCRFYHRPIDSGQFGRGVLRKQQSSNSGELQTIPCSKLTMLLECIRSLRNTITDSSRIVAI